MLPDELFLFTVCLAVHNSQLNEQQRFNQDRIEKKLDNVLDKISDIERNMNEKQS